MLTLDHHTDTHEAFVKFAYHKNAKSMVGIEPIMAKRLAEVEWRDHQSVRAAVNDLNNDEQIDAALQLGLFSYAFCFNNEHKNAIPGDTALAIDRVYWIGEECEDGFEELHAGQVLESELLAKLISRANNMAASVGIEDITKVPCVLDIDLDYFKTKNSISPADASLIHKLIKGSVLQSPLNPVLSRAAGR